MQDSKSRRFVYGLIVCLVIIFGITLAVKLLQKDPPQETPPLNTLIVSKSGGGQYKSISEALKNAQPEMRILVRPGLYEEKVIIDKPIEIIGDSNGTDQEIIIENTVSSCISVQAKHVIVRGLTMRVLPGIKASIVKFFEARNTVEEPCVEVTEGQCVIEDCDITSEAVAGIGIRGYMADPIVRRCKIHNGNSNGVWVVNHARASIEDCDIWGTSWAAMRIEDGANATLQRCKIYNVKNCGVVLTNYARGTISDCDIFDNALSGVEVRDRSSLTISKTKVHGCKDHGIWFRGNSTGQVEHCEVSNNGLVGLQVMEDSSPSILRCEIFDNVNSNMEINRGADPVVKECKIHGGAGSGIFVYESSRGTFEDCEIYGHQKCQQVVVRAGANPMFRRCKIYDGMAGGVLVLGDATGTLEDCDIYNNRSAGVWIRQNSSPIIRRCKINRNSAQGIVVHESGSVTVEQSDLTANLRGAWEVQPQCEVRSIRNKE